MIKMNNKKNVESEPLFEKIAIGGFLTSIIVASFLCLAIELCKAGLF